MWELTEALTHTMPGQHKNLRPLRAHGPTYKARAEAAKRWNADIVFCHHVNFDKTGKQSGMRAFVLADDEIAWEVADSLLRAAPKGLKWRGNPRYALKEDWTKRAHWVLKHYQELPVVLIEWGFISSESDREILTHPRHRRALQAAFYAGLGRAEELLWKGP